MYFWPKLRDGRPAPLSWQIKMLRFNVIVWPLSSEAPRWMWYAQLLFTIISFWLFMYLHLINVYFQYVSYPNMNEMLAGFATYAVTWETHVRSYHMAAYKQKFKHFLKRFYMDIYLDEETHPQAFKDIRLRSLTTSYYAINYIITYVLFFNLLMQGWLRGEKALMYKQAYPWDYRPWAHYLFVNAMNIWVGLVVIAQFFGETNILATCILHTGGRYRIMEENMQKFTKHLLNSELKSSELARQFRKGMMEFAKENAEINKFVVEMEATFTFRVFVMFSISSLYLCSVLFNLTSEGLTWQSAPFLSWLIAKISELLTVGELGSTLIKTTDNLSNVYYHSGWEDIMLKSDDALENVRLMKFVLMSMQVNARPLQLTGLNFIQVSIGTVLSVLQGAFSYFTFLRKFRN